MKGENQEERVLDHQTTPLSALHTTEFGLGLYHGFEGGTHICS